MCLCSVMCACKLFRCVTCNVSLLVQIPSRKSLPQLHTCCRCNANYSHSTKLSNFWGECWCIMLWSPCMYVRTLLSNCVKFIACMRMLCACESTPKFFHQTITWAHHVDLIPNTTWVEERKHCLYVISPLSHVGFWPNINTLKKLHLKCASLSSLQDAFACTYIIHESTHTLSPSPCTM